MSIPSSLETYIDKVGPKNNTEKYGLIQEIGKGMFGITYKARNLSRQHGEDEFYLVKIMLPPISNLARGWAKEVMCLKEVLEICGDSGILCYKDSFIFNQKGKKDYIVVTEFLDGYITLDEYFRKVKDKHKKLSENEAKEIYKKVVYIKNTLTVMCINHSDLHFSNIMIHPKTKDVKVIDFGKCKSTEQANVRSWDSDEERLKNLRDHLFEMVYDIHSDEEDVSEDVSEEEVDEDVSEEEVDEIQDEFEDMLIEYAPMNEYIPECKRKKMQLNQEDEEEKYLQREIELINLLEQLENDLNNLNSKQNTKNIFKIFFTQLISYKDIFDDQNNYLIQLIKSNILGKLLKLSEENEIFSEYYHQLK